MEDSQQQQPQSLPQAQASSSPPSKLRLTVYKNLNADKEHSEGRTIAFDPSSSLESLYQLCTEKLELSPPASKVFFQEGGVLDDLSLLRDNDILFISSGEAFYKKRASGLSKSVNSYKLCVLGGGAVGKSSLSLRFIRSFFPLDYDPTIEDSYTKQTEIDGRVCRLDVLDTAGQEDFGALFPEWVGKGRQGFMLVYSIESRQSYERVMQLSELLRQYREEPNLPITLVANKCDLEEIRDVTEAEGKQLAEKIGAQHFYETSARTYFNVENAFHSLVREIRKQAPPPPAPEEKEKGFLAKLCNVL